MRAGMKYMLVIVCSLMCALPYFLARHNEYIELSNENNRLEILIADQECVIEKAQRFLDLLNSRGHDGTHNLNATKED